MTVKGKLQENDVTGTFEAETDHMVPIYGLYSGQATEVVITLDDGTTTTFSVETEPVNVDLGTIQADMIDESSYDYSELTFVCSTMGASICTGWCRRYALLYQYGRYLGRTSVRNLGICVFRHRKCCILPIIKMDCWKLILWVKFIRSMMSRVGNTMIL